jgi:hypothetical protein
MGLSAQIVTLRPLPHPDCVLAPGDFPSDPKFARLLGIAMARGVSIRPLAYGLSAADLTVYARRGWPAGRAAALTAIPQVLVEAFNEGLADHRAKCDSSRTSLD